MTTLNYTATVTGKSRHNEAINCTGIARFMGPTWGPSGVDRTQVGPMLAPWTFLFQKLYNGEDCIYVYIVVSISWAFVRSIHINLLISWGLGDQWLLTIMVLKAEYYWIIRGITRLQMYMQRHATILCMINSTLSSMGNDFLCPYHLSVQKWYEFLK